MSANSKSISPVSKPVIETSSSSIRQEIDQLAKFDRKGGGRSTGGGLFSRGHIYKILGNPIYVGRIAHKGQVHEGQQPPIVKQACGTRSSKG